MRVLLLMLLVVFGCEQDRSVPLPEPDPISNWSDNPDSPFSDRFEMNKPIAPEKPPEDKVPEENPQLAATSVPSPELAAPIAVVAPTPVPEPAAPIAEAVPVPAPEPAATAPAAAAAATDSPQPDPTMQ